MAGKTNSIRHNENLIRHLKYVVIIPDIKD